MRMRVNRHAAHSFVVLFGAVLVVVGAGFAAARTAGGPPWALPVVSPSPSATSAETPGPARDGGRHAADAQAFFDGLHHGCGSAILGDVDLSDPATDRQTARAFVGLADALNSGQIDHGVQGVRSVLKDCEAHANDGLRNALSRLGLNWARHYQHELWLEQKFAAKWPDGKPGHDETGSHGKPPWAGQHSGGKPDEADHADDAGESGHDNPPGRGSPGASHGPANGPK